MYAGLSLAWQRQAMTRQQAMRIRHSQKHTACHSTSSLSCRNCWKRQTGLMEHRYASGIGREMTEKGFDWDGMLRACHAHDLGCFYMWIYFSLNLMKASFARLPVRELSEAMCYITNLLTVLIGLTHKYHKEIHWRSVIWLWGGWTGIKDRKWSTVKALSIILICVISPHVFISSGFKNCRYKRSVIVLDVLLFSLFSHVHHQKSLPNPQHSWNDCVWEKCCESTCLFLEYTVAANWLYQ